MHLQIPIAEIKVSMAFIQFLPLPISLTKMKMLSMGEISSFIRRNNVTSQIRCTVSNTNFDNSSQILRRSSNFQPSIWNYDYIQSLSSDHMEELYEEHSRMLKEEIRVMLCKSVNHVDQLELIDILQRLGISYHFNNEIKNILDNVYSTDASQRKKSLHVTALEFRLLRQYGYNITTDVFHSFQDKNGEFKKCQFVEVEGMLSLYEASFLSLEDEAILDAARDFTSEFLKDYVGKNEGDYLSLLISHALEIPLHWRVPRCEAQWFINVYENSHNMSSTLLQFAKIDFNIVQAIHQEELKQASRWWKKIGFVEKLSFSRDRLVENFLWTVGANFDPDFGYFRSVITKLNSLVTTIDDIYDVYGTLDELELFTQAVDRWDQNYAMENLPDYMKTCFLALYNYVSEISLETVKKNGFNSTPYLKKAWADLCKSYFTEAKWYHNRYKPSLEEYMKNAWISISLPVALVHTYFSIPNSFTQEDLVCLEEHPNLTRFSGMLLRLANDLGSSKREVETGDVPNSIQCYMIESGASEAEAREHVKSLMSTIWKKMNKEVQNSSFPQSFIDIAVNFPRMALSFYQFGDGYTDQDIETTNRGVPSLVLQPFL
ncbi:hypothetical protein RJT34_27159 [Clitoria ternatea]|uniref:Uncharacterized protein n=1 Tax=Clitoria ternatea TaxID=43366 RepID=A0AAN9IG68_CLITE